MINLLKNASYVAVIRADTSEEAYQIIDSCLAGGSKVIELTMTTPRAIEIIKTYIDKQLKDVIFGMGSVQTTEEILELKKVNIDFVATAYLDEEVVCCAIENDIFIIPGVMTLSELMKAKKIGAKMFKLFPANNFNPKIINDFQGPCGHLNIMPTGGIDKNNIIEWLEKGYVCCGIGSDLYKGIKENDLQQIIEYNKELNKEIETWKS